MKNIQPIYATFELSKLLKEKEWQQRTKMVWLDFLGKQHLREVNLSLKLQTAEYDAPEQWQVVEWLRVNHGIWINVKPDCYGESWYVDLNVCLEKVWENLDKRHEIVSAFRKFINEHKSPQEAYSAAFDYIKDNNLI